MARRFAELAGAVRAAAGRLHTRAHNRRDSARFPRLRRLAASVFHIRAYVPTGGARAWARAAAALKSKLRFRAGVYAIVAASLAITAVQMVRLHPYQYIYFNPLAGVHENLGETYEMDYWGIERREALERQLTTYPKQRIIVKTDVPSRWDIDRNLYVIPKDERRRISARSELPHFHVTDTGEAPIWSREIYGVPIVSVIDMREETEAAYRDAYVRALSSAPIARGGFDVYLDGGELIYVKEPCAAEDARGRFLLSVFPKRQDDLPEYAQSAGLTHESLNFDFHINGWRTDGACVIMRTLPDYPIASIQTGQWMPGGESLWMATAILDESALSPYRQALALAAASEPVASSGFDMYPDDGALIYVKDPCAANDARGRFLLSVFPKRQDDLPEKFRELGHESLNFDFDDYGAAFDGKCVIMRALPDYPIASIERDGAVDTGRRKAVDCGVRYCRRLAARTALQRPSRGRRFGSASDTARLSRSRSSPQSASPFSMITGSQPTRGSSGI